MSAKLSDDYINEPGAFTGAFVGMNCVDITGSGMPADFDYFSYRECGD
jgi:xylan 1,4-beta-xylosidase